MAGEEVVPQEVLSSKGKIAAEVVEEIGEMECDDEVVVNGYVDEEIVEDEAVTEEESAPGHEEEIILEDDVEVVGDVPQPSPYQLEWEQAESRDAFTARSLDYEGVIKQLVEEKLLNDDEHVVDVFDIDEFDERINTLLEAFPEEFITHTLGVKAQPLAGILKRALEKYPRFGLKCASSQEAWLAYQLGTPTTSIVYHSPVKSRKQLLLAIKSGFHVNCDNTLEMDMIDNILSTFPGGRQGTRSRFGVHLNPIVENGGSSGRAGIESKFGFIYCDETFDEIVSLFQKYTWLEGLHCHVGSQGSMPKLIASGAAVIYKAAELINSRLGENRIRILDIGGGVPTSYSQPHEAVKFSEYRQVLDEKVPNFFSGKYRIIMEFGRSVFTKCGITLTRVSSVKASDANSDSMIAQFRALAKVNPTIITHVGSNGFLREAYQMKSGMWRRRITVFNSDGSAKIGSDVEFANQDIAGPLCTSGDYIVKDVPLPIDIKHDDIVLIHDTGAYTYSMYCRYNSYPAHTVYGLYRYMVECPKTFLPVPARRFKRIKQAEKIYELLDFWGLQGRE